MKLLYLFTGDRTQLIARVRQGEDADTLLYGWNHIAGAEQHFLPQTLCAACSIPHLLQYDVIVSQDHLLIGYLVSLVARLFRRNTKWIHISMTSSNMIRRHAHHPLRRILLRKFWRSYERIVCLSRVQLEDLARFGISRERLAFIPFGVDADFFRTTDAGSSGGSVVSVGRDFGRDYATLLEAVSGQDYPVIIVAGEKNISRGALIPPNVSVLYDRPLSEIRNIYAHAGVVAIISKNETVSDGSDCSGQIAILDALASGKTVITTRRSWIADYVVPGEDLFVVEPSDPDTLRTTIAKLLADSALRTRVAEAGRHKVCERYTTKIFGGAIAELAASLV